MTLPTEDQTRDVLGLSFQERRIDALMMSSTQGFMKWRPKESELTNCKVYIPATTNPSITLIKVTECN